MGFVQGGVVIQVVDVDNPGYAAVSAQRDVMLDIIVTFDTANEEIIPLDEAMYMWLMSHTMKLDA